MHLPTVFIISACLLAVVANCLVLWLWVFRSDPDEQDETESTELSKHIETTIYSSPSYGLRVVK